MEKGEYKILITDRNKIEYLVSHQFQTLKTTKRSNKIFDNKYIFKNNKDKTTKLNEISKILKSLIILKPFKNDTLCI